MQVKIGMVDLVSTSMSSEKKFCTRMALVVREYEHDYLVHWGKVVRGSAITPNGALISKERVYNIQERNISKFRFWCYTHWDNNFY